MEAFVEIFLVLTGKTTAFPAETPELADAAIAQKSRARSNRSQRDIRLLVGFAGGFASCAAIAMLLGASPWHGESWFLLCSLVGAVAGSLLASKLSQKEAACPVCKHSWEIKEGRAVPVNERMETWDKCPGCGLLMADWALQRASEGKPRLGPNG